LLKAVAGRFTHIIFLVVGGGGGGWWFWNFIKIYYKFLY